MRAGARFPAAAEQAAFVQLLRYLCGRVDMDRGRVLAALVGDMVSAVGGGMGDVSSRRLRYLSGRVAVDGGGVLAALSVPGVVGGEGFKEKQASWQVADTCLLSCLLMPIADHMAA